MIVTDDHNSYYQGYPQRLIKAVILVHPFIHIVTNYDFLDCDAEEYRQHLVSGEDNDGPEPTVVNRRNFYKLDEMRAGKGIYIPDDLIQYYNPDYIEKSPQVEAMRKFLMGLENTSKYCQAEEDGDEDADDIDHAADEFDPDADEFDPDGQRRFIADLVIMEMRNIARDVLVYPADAFDYMLKIVKQHGFIFEDIEQAEMCRDLYAELSNHTRRPSNGGYTPHELMQKKMRESGKPGSGFLGGFPQSMSFGSGIVNSIQNGTLDGNELKKMIIGHEQFPMELKANLLKEVDKAMKGVGKNDKSEKASNQAADRNAPCPCGSGKKYKHCCGKLN